MPFSIPPTHLDELLIALSSLIGHTGHVGVTLLTVLPHHTAVVELVLAKEPLWVVVGVNVHLGQGIVSGWFLYTLVDTRLQPWQEQLQPKKHQDFRLKHTTTIFLGTGLPHFEGKLYNFSPTKN